MDCEKFDLHVMDALYDELDELTYAALKRHVEGCSRCSGIFTGLRATREVGLLPMEEPSDDFEARILDAVATAQKRAPWPRKILRGLAWAGSHAMRPQLAMAALFFLVIGSSLLLLRAKPGTVGVAPVRVTERGAPGPEAEAPPSPVAAAAPVQPVEATAAAAPAAAAPSSAALAINEPPKDPDPYADSKDQASAVAKPTDKADKPDKDSAKLALDDARAVRSGGGCAAAVSKYDEVGARFPGTAAAADAMWEAASCYKSMGDAAKARELFLALASTGYRDRAQRELEGSDNNAMNNVAQSQMASRAAAGAAKIAAASPAPAAAPPAAAKPAGAPPEAVEAPAKSKYSGGSPGKANAAPRKAAADTSAF